MKAFFFFAAALMLFPAKPSALDAMEVIEDVQWWGGGFSTRGPACSDPETCVGSITLKFETIGRRVRVFVFINPGQKAYEAYGKNKRYPGDTKLRSADPMWVEFDRAQLSFQNGYSWACELLSPMRIDCSVRPQGGMSYPFTVQPLPPGPSPTTWPE